MRVYSYKLLPGGNDIGMEKKEIISTQFFFLFHHRSHPPPPPRLVATPPSGPKLHSPLPVFNPPLPASGPRPSHPLCAGSCLLLYTSYPTSKGRPTPAADPVFVNFGSPHALMADQGPARGRGVGGGGHLGINESLSGGSKVVRGKKGPGVGGH